MISITWSTYRSQTHRDRKQNSGSQGMGGEDNKKLLLNRYRISVWDNENSGGDDGSDDYTTINVNVLNARELHT